MSRRLFEDLSDLPDAGPAAAEPAQRPRTERPCADADLSDREDAVLLLPADAPTQSGRDADSGRVRRSRLGRVLFAAVLALAALLLGRGLYAFVVEAFEFNPAFGWTQTGLLAMLAVLLGCAVAGEWRALLRLRHGERLRGLCRRAAAEPGSAEAQNELIRGLAGLLADVESRAPAAVRGRAAQVRLRLGPESSAADWVQAMEEELLAPLDRQVERTIQKEALNVGLGTAISPYGFLDAAVALWRNARMVSRIAQAYQVRPGAWGTCRLVRRAVVAVALADLAQETSTALLGAFRGVSSMLSPVGQGLTNAALTIRLGLLAQQECRPLPLPEASRRHTASMLSGSVLGPIRRMLRARIRGEGRPHEAQTDA